MNKTTEQKVADILIEQLGCDADQVMPSSSIIDDLGADSLDCIELIMEFEEEFNIEIPDIDAEAIKTVGDITRYIKNRLAE